MRGRRSPGWPFPPTAAGSRFVAGSGSRSRLFIRSLDAVVPEALPGTESAVSPFWSPDGSQLGFFAGGKLRKIAPSGGPPQVICDAGSGGSGSWGPGGVILIGQWEGGPNQGILRVSAEGGTPAPVTKPASGHRAHRWPVFLPDGRRFLFLDWTFGGEKRVISVGSLDSGRIQPLFEADSRVEYAPQGFLLFVRDATLLARPFDPKRLAFGGDAIPVAQSIAYFGQSGSGAFSASARSNVLAYQPRPFDSRLVWLDREGHSLASVGAPAMFHLPPRLSPDGRRVAVTVRDPRTGIRDLWLYDAVTGLPTRLTSAARDAVRPVWSPDGARLAYALSRESAPDIYIWDVASGREELVLSQPGTQLPQDWSSDGARLVYQDFSPARMPPLRTAVLRLGAKPTAAPASPGPPYSEYSASFSPDGRWLALVSEESGEPEVYLVPAVGTGERRRVSTAGGDNPRWRRDGRELYYLDGEGRLLAAPVAPAASGIELGSSRVLFSAGPSAIDFDVTAAGDRFLFRMGMGSRPQPPIVVSLDWAAGLEK